MGLSASTQKQQLVQAEVAKLQAEAAAATQRAAADAAKAAATTQRAAADEAKAQAEAFRSKVAWCSGVVLAVAGVGLAAGLAVDFYRHESPAHIKRKMRKMLLSFKPPTLGMELPKTLIKVAQPPLISQLTAKPSEHPAAARVAGPAGSLSPAAPLTPSPVPAAVLVGPSGCGKVRRCVQRRSCVFRYRSAR